MTQLLLQPPLEISNLINGFRHVCNITPAAPPRPRGARGPQGGCSGTGREIRGWEDRCTDTRARCDRAPRRFALTFTSAGARVACVWRASLAGPAAAASQAAVQMSSLSATSSGKLRERGHRSTHHLRSHSTFCLRCTRGNARTWWQGGVWQVGRKHLFSL